jgi:hypothetical protein
MATGIDAATDAQILSEVIAPERPDFAPEVARPILSLRFSEPQKSRMRELAARNAEGTITEIERAEMESYRRVGNLLALLQAKARLSLKHAQSDASPP